MGDRGNRDDLKPEVASDLVEYYVRIYENLADDALSILSIQLFVIPISISLTSLFLVSGGNKDKEPSKMLIELYNSGDSNLMIWGIIFASFSVCTSALSYYLARRTASKRPNLLINYRNLQQRYLEESEVSLVEYIDEQAKNNSSTPYRVYNSIIKPTRETYQQAINEYENPTVEETLVSEFDTVFSLEQQLRNTLFLSLITSLMSVSFFFIGILESSFSVIADTMVLASIIVALLVYLPTVSMTFGILEGVVASLGFLVRFVFYTPFYYFRTAELHSEVQNIFRYHPEFYHVVLNSLVAMAVVFLNSQIIT